MQKKHTILAFMLPQYIATHLNNTNWINAMHPTKK